MTDYLKDRKHYVYYNGSNSTIKNIGNNNCFQGTIMATILYLIYVLDQPFIAHINCDHMNIYEDISKCNKFYSSNYVDDNLTEVTTDNWNNLENESQKYLKNMLDYHVNNNLAFNHDKTNIMINSSKKKHRKKKRKFNNVSLEHKKKLNILCLYTMKI